MVVGLVEKVFPKDEEINRISGTTGSRDGFIIISSLSFATNKSTHEPFSQPTETSFSIPWDKGSVVGFYGLVGDYIDSIGIYVKPNEEIVRIGTWGRITPGALGNIWSFQLKNNQHLKKITIEHGNSVISVIFTTQYRILIHTSERVGHVWVFRKVNERFLSYHLIGTRK